jgi:nicotinamidase-related amidase
MTAEALLEMLQQEMPVATIPYAPPSGVGLVIVDAVNGFCTVGAGNLAPRAPNAQVARMVEVTTALARRFRERRLPVLAFLDTHEPDKPEPPYPPHCVRGTGEEDFVPELAWLADDPDVTLIRKDCLNPFVGAMEPTFVKGSHGATRNRLTEWIVAHRLTAVVVTGICTDICVLDLASTLLAARNHGLVPTLKDVVVLEPATATYDLPLDATRKLGLPPTAAHPQAPAHHVGLYVLASRGAVLASAVTGF